MAKQSNQRGFTVVEALLAIIAVTLIVFVFMYVYRAGQSSKSDDSLNKNLSSQDASQAEPKPAQKPIEYLNIPGASVKVPASGELKNLRYYVGKDVIHLYTDKLISMGKECTHSLDEATPEYVWFMAIAKKPGQYPARPTIDDGNLLKQFPDFFVGAGVPNGDVCDYQSHPEETAAFRTYTKKLQDATIEAFKSAEQT